MDGIPFDYKVGTVLSDPFGGLDDTLFLYDENNELILLAKDTIQKYDDYYRNTTFPGNRNIVQMLINEMLGRQGYRFEKPDVIEYYSKYDWYKNVEHTLSMQEAESKMNASEWKTYDYLAHLRDEG